jgi:hypothetical protein
MDREDGFPPHVIGFMKRKREKEKPDDAKPLEAALLGDEPGRAHRSTWPFMQALRPEYKRPAPARAEKPCCRLNLSFGSKTYD